MSNWSPSPREYMMPGWEDEIDDDLPLYEGTNPTECDNCGRGVLERDVVVLGDPLRYCCPICASLDDAGRASRRPVEVAL